MVGCCSSAAASLCAGRLRAGVGAGACGRAGAISQPPYHLSCCSLLSPAQWLLLTKHALWTVHNSQAARAARFASHITPATPHACNHPPLPPIAPAAVNDQTGFYRVVRKTPYKQDHGKLTYFANSGSGSSASLGTIPISVLLNGYTYFIERGHQVAGVQPLGVHFTWVSLSKEGKLHR